MTTHEAKRYIIHQLKTIYQEGEAAAICNLVLEYIVPATQKYRTLTAQQQSGLKIIIDRLLLHEPVQYVLNEAWFGGLKFYTDKNVLIPRPETEELVEWVISGCRASADEIKILDIGSGSGCIPVLLKKRIPKAEVWSCDVSEEALNVAKKNAAESGTGINFLTLDFLNRDSWKPLPSFDIIVSNPPYIPEKDKEQMLPNVLNYEPHLALFVPNSDPFIFYKAIAEFGKQRLKKVGSIYLEIQENSGKEITGLFQSAGYYTELKKDMQQKERMIRLQF